MTEQFASSQFATSQFAAQSIIAEAFAASQFAFTQYATDLILAPSPGEIITPRKASLTITARQFDRVLKPLKTLGTIIVKPE